MSRKAVLVVVVVLGAGAAAGWVLVADPFGRAEPLPPSTRKDMKTKEVANGYKYWPASGAVEMGVEYEFDSQHCGLEWLTDFDGSFWTPEEVPGKDPDFYYNQDQGTMTLVSANTAEYRSSTGEVAVLHRHEGPIVVEGACA